MTNPDEREHVTYPYVPPRVPDGSDWIGKPVTVTRDVPSGEYSNSLGRAVQQGEVFYNFLGPTYGCCGPEQISLTEGVVNGHVQFFGFPQNAVEQPDWPI